MMRCQMCGQKTTNRKRKRDGNVVLCDFCRACAEAARIAEAEWQAQTGNPNFQGDECQSQE